jgi:hypothetical protein
MRISLGLLARASLAVGQAVKTVNWTIRNDLTFAPDGDQYARR